MERTIYRVYAHKRNYTDTKFSHDIAKALVYFDKWAGDPQWNLVRLMQERQRIDDDTGEITVIDTSYLYVSNEQDLTLASRVKPILRPAKN